jgi:hypothetical protein
MGPFREVRVLWLYFPVIYGTNDVHANNLLLLEQVSDLEVILLNNIMPTHHYRIHMCKKTSYLS